MTNEELARRAIHAESAWEEFIGPVIEQMRAEYMAALTRIAANEPWESGKITKLAIAQRVIDAVEEHLRAAIAHGEIAARDQDRIARIQSLPDRKRRWL
jgi:hypothetical protein